MKATKVKQCSKQTCLQIIVLLNKTTNTSIKEMVNKKYTNNTIRINGKQNTQATQQTTMFTFIEISSC